MPDPIQSPDDAALREKLAQAQAALQSPERAALPPVDSVPNSSLPAAAPIQSKPSAQPSRQKTDAEDLRVRVAAAQAVLAEREGKREKLPEGQPAPATSSDKPSAKKPKQLPEPQDQEGPSFLQELYLQRRELPSWGHAIGAMITGRQLKRPAPNYDQDVAKDLTRLLLPTWAEALGFNEEVERPSRKRLPEPQTVEPIAQQPGASDPSARSTSDPSPPGSDKSDSSSGDTSKPQPSPLQPSDTKKPQLPATMGEAIQRTREPSAREKDLTERLDQARGFAKRWRTWEGESTTDDKRKYATQQAEHWEKEAAKLEKQLDKARERADQKHANRMAEFPQGAIGEEAAFGKKYGATPADQNPDESSPPRGLLPDHPFSVPGMPGGMNPTAGGTPRLPKVSGGAGLPAGSGSKTWTRLPSFGEPFADGPTSAKGAMDKEGQAELLKAIKDLTSAVKKLADVEEKKGRSSGSGKGGSSVAAEVMGQGAKNTFDLLKKAVANAGNEMIGRFTGSPVSRPGGAGPGGAAAASGAAPAEATASAAGAAATAATAARATAAMAAAS